MQFEFADLAYSRTEYGLAEARLVNCYVEATPAGPTKSARIQRPGLKRSYSVGAGPIWGLFQEDGVFGGDRFAVSGTGVYREGIFLGTVIPDGVARFASSKTQLVVVAGGLAYCYDGSTLAQITDPDLPLVSDVIYLAGRFYYLQKDSDIWWWSALNDATSIDGLAFATAESAPDANIGGAILNDEVWFFGTTTIEPWYQTGDANQPLQRAQGRKFDRGCCAQQSIVRTDNTLFWVGDDRIAYRAAGVPRRISTHGIEGRLRRCATPSAISGWSASFDGHSFYGLNIPGEGSFAYDISTARWSEFASHGQATFRGRCSATTGGVIYFGDAEAGVVWSLDPESLTDDVDPIERVVSVFVPVQGVAARCDNILFVGSRGVGLEDNSNPQIQARWSDDGGRTWSNWRAQSLGLVGQYHKKAIWRRLGRMGSPGRAFEFRVTDPVQVVFAGIGMNEAQP